MVKSISPTPDLPSPRPSDVVYPDSDGQLMAENTEQFSWIVKIKEGLEWLFAEQADVFVAGDLLWYPVEGDNKTRAAPDALVAFGRPKGRRGSYMQWVEGGIAPQVVFEVLSPGNSAAEMDQKRRFYERFGVEEYYLYDPDRLQLQGWRRLGNLLEPIPSMDGWVSPRLGIRFQMNAELHLFAPNGRPFLSYVEMAKKERHSAERAEQERQRAEQDRQRAERLAAQLRALGIEPTE